MPRMTIYAAGGIVVRGGAHPRVAVVQRRKDELWVLPRGKLRRDERAIAGARREVVEGTGHRVVVREFLGAMAYRVRGRSKVVQFWRMQAAAHPSRDLMKDIMAVEWLPLAAAIRRLSYPLEKLFLRSIGRDEVLRNKRNPPRKPGVGVRKVNRLHSTSRTGRAKTTASKTKARAGRTVLRRMLRRFAT